MLREPCGELGAERIGFEETDKQEFCKSDRGVISQELAVGELLVEDRHEVVLSSDKSYTLHLKTDARQPMMEKNGVFEVGYDLSPCAVGLKQSPRRDE